MLIRKLVLFVIVFVFSLQLYSQDQQELFMKAAKTNNVEMLQELIDKGVDVNSKNEYGASVLMFAASKGNVDAVKLLLENGADPNMQDAFYNTSPFEWSIQKSNVEILKAMIMHGADLSNPDFVLMIAGIGDSGLIKLMLEKGAQGADKIFLSAVRNAKLEIIKIVLESTEVTNEILSTALFVATLGKNLDIVEFLRKAGAILPENSVEFDPDKLTNYVGIYKSEYGEILKINEKDGAIYSDFNGGYEYEMGFRGEHIFDFLQYPGRALIFHETGGQVVSVEMAQGEYKRSYLRITEIEQIEKREIKDEAHKVENPINWPSFRGDKASGIADGQYPPVVWDVEKGLNVKWKTYIPGLAHASPILWEDKVFLITALGNDTTAEYRVGLYGDVEDVNDTSLHIWKMYCLNKYTGKIIWEQKAYEGIPRVKRHTKATQANSTPVTNGKFVVALFGSEGMVCYDMDGLEKWRKDLGMLDAGWFFEEETQWGHSSSPIIYNDMIIIQCDRSKNSFIAAYNIETGEEIWRTERDAISSWGTPAVYYGKDHDELITNGAKFIRGYNPMTGEELWRLAPNSEITVATPVVMNDLIFVTAGYMPVSPIYAIIPGGKGDISIPDSLNSGENIKWRTKRGGTYMPSPIAYKDYFYTLNNNGLLTCYIAETGEKKYSKRIENGGAFTASILAADGKLYCTSEERGIFVIKAGSEYEFISSNPVGEICMATPAISDGMIFIRGQHHIICIQHSPAKAGGNLRGGNSKCIHDKKMRFE